jgi:transcriptional regulator with XRE-family HTH domain
MFSNIVITVYSGVKRKMTNTKLGEWAGRIKDLRAALEFTQDRLAKELDVKQGTVSAWETGDPDKYFPSAEMYSYLGNLAADNGYDPTWFWEQAGLEIRSLEQFAEKRLKERGSAPEVGEIVRVGSLKGWPGIPAGSRSDDLILPARFVPNPAATKFVAVGGDIKSSTFPHGDILVIDTSNAELSSLWDKVVLAYFDPKEKDRRPPYARWPDGLFVARLRCREWDRLSLTWVAQLTSLIGEDSSAEDISVGFWKPETSELPSLVTARRAAQTKARELAPAKLRLSPGCRILGQMICWLSSKSSVQSGKLPVERGRAK